MIGKKEFVKIWFGIGCWIRWTRQNLFKSQSFCYHCNLPNVKKKLVKLLQFTKMILNTYLENLWKKERCEERKSENEVFGLDFSDSMQGFFFFLLFLDSLSSQKKLGWGKKLALKIWNGRHFIRFTCFLFCSSEKIWTANFPVAISRDFFLPFLLPKFSVAQPSPHTENSSTGAAKEVNCTVLLTVILSRSIH